MKHNPLFHIVLHEPEIPNNTGNIGRTCVATGSALHLIHPLGFDVSEKACRRAGLDYWARLDVHEHESWERYLAACDPKSIWLVSTRAQKPLYEADFKLGDHLVFGNETAGLPAELLDSAPDRAIVLPMAPQERSLNVATAVCAVIYEGIRQLAAQGQICLGPGATLVRQEASQEADPHGHFA